MLPSRYAASRPGGSHSAGDGRVFRSLARCGAIGGHQAAVRAAYEDFRGLAETLKLRMGG